MLTCCCGGWGARGEGRPTETAKNKSELFLPTSACVGLLDFQHPQLPRDLNEGYPQAYVRKPEGECTPVSHIVRAVQQQQGEEAWQHADICTFRNNLNKVLMTPNCLDSPWVIDAVCVNGTVFLDIASSGPEQNFPDSDK